MHKHITDVFLNGFTRQSVNEGETVELIARDVATSESPIFFIYAEQIANLVCPQLDVSSDNIDRYLIVLHTDASTNVYVHDVQTRVKVRLSRSVSPGDIVRWNDLSSIENVQFPGKSIVEGDRLVYFERKGWRFGIAFDLTRKIDQSEFGTLCAALQTKLILEDIFQVTLAELHKAEKIGFDAFIITEGKTDWRHLERALHKIGYRQSCVTTLPIRIVVIRSF